MGTLRAAAESAEAEGKRMRRQGEANADGEAVGAAHEDGEAAVVGEGNPEPPRVVMMDDEDVDNSGGSIRLDGSEVAGAELDPACRDEEKVKDCQYMGEAEAEPMREVAGEVERNGGAEGLGPWEGMSKGNREEDSATEEVAVMEESKEEGIEEDEERRRMAAPGLWEEDSCVALSGGMKVAKAESDEEGIGGGGHISVVSALEREKAGLEREVREALQERERLRRQVADVRERMEGLRERTQLAYEVLEREKRGVERGLLEMRNENVRLKAEVGKLRIRERGMLDLLQSVREAVEERMKVFGGAGSGEGEDVVEGESEGRDRREEGGAPEARSKEGEKLCEMERENEKLRARAAYLQRENGRMGKEMRAMEAEAGIRAGGGAGRERGGGGEGGGVAGGTTSKEERGTGQRDVVVQRQEQAMTQVCVVTFGGW